jgi:hypothetical protein
VALKEQYSPYGIEMPPLIWLSPSRIRIRKSKRSIQKAYQRREKIRLALVVSYVCSVRQCKKNKRFVTEVGLEPTLVSEPGIDVKSKTLTWRHNQLGHPAMGE